MMKHLRTRLLPLVAAFALFAVGCSDAPTPSAPEKVDETAALLGGLTDTVTDLVGRLTTLRRTDPVATGVCAEATIGRRGGTVVCEEAGLRLEFPRGALRRNTRITVNVPRGDLVGYEFQPHGIEFRRPVRLYQSLDGTAAEDPFILDLLVGVYVGEIGDLVNPLEILPAQRTRDNEVALDIRHFSGYVCATN